MVGLGPPPHLINQLKAGEAVPDSRGHVPMRWAGEVVTTPDGTQRLVVAGTEAFGDVGPGIAGLWLGVLVGTVVVGITIWFATGRALRPVARMRTAATDLPEGERLPPPATRDEIRALAEALNAMPAARWVDPDVLNH
ncbi:hypothetical protein GCM10012275_12630 [Longimycelium tulufanense]|uniref:HAMP domain-containing protein n=1 Tax=Longimycelium tulufanense TaxID=907463 RepID=A0A8J3CBS8_9PSEU|nr:hypothetical protein GCM10012275_12630 [Longimycelium tulufanense]